MVSETPTSMNGRASRTTFKTACAEYGSNKLYFLSNLFFLFLTKPHVKFPSHSQKHDTSQNYKVDSKENTQKVKPKTQVVRQKNIRAKMQKYDTIYFYSKFRKKQITYNGNISLKIQRGKNTGLYKSITDKNK